MNAVRADRRLIDRCLSGEPTAWDQLYEHYHPLLLVAAGLWLGRHASDTDLVEEIAARVWYALVKDHGRLLDRFDTARGCRLVTFIARIAKSEIRQYFRSERRRRAREKVASQYEIDLRGLSVGQLETLLEEFADSLTPREKQFLRSNLLGRQVDGRQESISHANQWQLKHRIRRKLRSFTRFG